MSGGKLTPKQQRFVEEFLIDQNASRAAIRAGYSPNGSRQTAAKLLTKADIKRAIMEHNAERSEMEKVDAAWVLKEAQFLYDKLKDREDFALAFKGLEMIGKHVDVSAFSRDIGSANSGVTINLSLEAGEPKLLLNQGVTVDGETVQGDE